MIRRLAARRRRWAYGCFFAALAMSFAMLGPAHQAEAAVPLGGLLLSPGSGVASSPISMVTVSSGAEKGCPAPSMNVVGYITGPGGWSGGILGVQKTSIGVSQTEDFGVDLADSFAGIATSNSVALVAGRYTITVYCQAGLGTTQYGEFSAPVWFTDATHYQTTDPTAPGSTPTPTPTPAPTSPGAATSTSITLTSPADAALGADVTLTALVSPPAATGQVTFLDGTGAAATAVGTGAVSGGVATLTTASLTTGTHTLTASFVPAEPALYAASRSAAVNLTITAPAGPPLLGSLLLTPDYGDAASPISMITVSTSSTQKGCPAPSTNVVGYITGPGGWAGGILGVQNSSTGVSLTSDFSIDLTDSFGGIAQSNSVDLVAGQYTITVYCGKSLGNDRYGMFQKVIWFTDATHYQSNDPGSSQSLTQTTVSASPEDRATIGDTVSLTAAITPATTTGTVQFRDNRNGTFAAIGAPVPVSGGRATLLTKNLPFGLYQFSALYTPADVKKFASSASEDVVFAVTLPVPPVPGARAVIAGKVKAGSTITCSGTFKNATSTTFQWIRDRGTIVGASRAYTLVTADGGHAIRCRILATNAGGTTSRTSVASRVAR